jgi:hypothetical protein
MSLAARVDSKLLATMGGEVAVAPAIVLDARANRRSANARRHAGHRERYDDLPKMVVRASTGTAVATPRGMPVVRVAVQWRKDSQRRRSDACALPHNL